jgi:glycosyltransferase involved in cell wall biosynthesis
MGKLKLNICSYGDPMSPKTWSGTPFHLYSELAKMDCLGTAFNFVALRNKYIRLFPNLFLYLFYRGSIDLKRGFFHRFLNSIRVKRKTQESSTNFTLHTDTCDLPFYKLPINQKHYLFIDSTWNLWSTQYTGMKNYSKKMIYDIEKFESKAYKQMEHIFPISEYVKDNLIEHYGVNPNKITVVGTGLGVIQPYYGKKDYSNGKILYVAKGRFEDKGGFIVLDAFKIALEKNPHLELIIVGQNEYQDKIKSPNIKTYGFIPIEQLQELFNESSLFLMPAINEPWGLVFLEALACKMPIVGLERNSFPELSGNGKYGYSLKEINSEKLANLLVKAFANPEKLEEMGAKGQEFCVNKYTWKNTVTTIVNTIENQSKLK